MHFELVGGEGFCHVEPDGLYWRIEASCRSSGDAPPRLFCGAQSLGPFWRAGAGWLLQTRRSRRSLPICPDTSFSLCAPCLIRYDPDAPLPHMEDFCRLRPILQNGTLYLSCPTA